MLLKKDHYVQGKDISLRRKRMIEACFSETLVFSNISFIHDYKWMFCLLLETKVLDEKFPDVFKKGSQLFKVHFPEQFGSLLISVGYNLVLEFNDFSIKCIGYLQPPEGRYFLKLLETWYI